MRKIRNLLRTAIEKDVTSKCGAKNKSLAKKIIAQRMAYVPSFIVNLELDVRQLRELPESDLNLNWYAGQLAEYFETMLGARVTSTDENEYSHLLQFLFSCARVIKSPTTKIYRYANAGINSISNDPRLTFKLLTKQERSRAQSSYYFHQSRERATHEAKQEKAKKTPPM